MKKTTVFVLILVVFYSFLISSAYAERKDYIKKGPAFTEIISIKSKVHHSDDIMNINTFYKPGSKVDWEKPSNIVSYRYLGIDNNNNLHIERREKAFLLKIEDRCSLIFKLDSKQTGAIIFIGKRSQKQPLLIKMEVKATNLGIEVKYLGNLPEYKKE